MDKPDKNQFYVASYKLPKKLKILNLVITEGLINGVSGGMAFDSNDKKELSYSENQIIQFIEIWPLICATSYSVENNDRKFKSEYIISQLLMLSFKKLGIDGVAYISKKFLMIILMYFTVQT